MRKLTHIGSAWLLFSGNGWLRSWSWIVLLVGCPFVLWAQTATPTDTTKNARISVDYSDVFEYIIEGDTTIQRLVGDVELHQDSVYMYCDSATIIGRYRVIAEGSVIIQQGDSTSVFADSLVYQGDKKIARLYGEVALTNREQRLFTDQLKYDLNTKVATYVTGATLTNGATQLTSKVGYFFVESNQAFFKDSVVVVDPAFTLFSDTLAFNTKTEVVTFLGPTLIDSDSARIYCEAGFYDTQTEVAEFRQNAQFLRGDQQAVAEKITYDGTLGQYTLEGNARFRENERRARADAIVYDERTGETRLLGNARYRDGTQNIESKEIVYNAETERYSARGRSVVSDPPQLLVADTIDYQKETGLGIALGNVIWRDTAEDLTIRCEIANYNQDTDYFKAWGKRPMLITVIEGDTLYLASDTLLAIRKDALTSTSDSTAISPDSSAVVADSVLDSPVQPPAVLPFDTLATVPLLFDSTLTTFAEDSLASPSVGKDSARILIAQRNVRVFKSNLQAVCDSLTYDTRDSVFQFFVEPIIWSDTSQFYADTVRMLSANGGIDRILLNSNAFILNSTDEIFFNQVNGRNIVAYFREDELRRMHVTGNARSVYYALDDRQAYIGVNQTQATRMILFFGNNEVERIKFINQPTAQLLPMGQTNHQTLRLEGFRWERARRPRSAADVR